MPRRRMRFGTVIGRAARMRWVVVGEMLRRFCLVRRLAVVEVVSVEIVCSCRRKLRENWSGERVGKFEGEVDSGGGGRDVAAGLKNSGSGKSFKSLGD